MSLRLTDVSLYCYDGFIVHDMFIFVDIGNDPWTTCNMSLLSNFIMWSCVEWRWRTIYWSVKSSSSSTSTTTATATALTVTHRKKLSSANVCGQRGDVCSVWTWCMVWQLLLNTRAGKNLHEVWSFKIMLKTTWAFSWLKTTTSVFTFKTLSRHYAKRASTHGK